MNIYTKKGDQGMTSLGNGQRIPKTDNRIELLGTIDELSSHLGLAKAAAPADLNSEISELQAQLILVMAAIADPGNEKYKLDESVLKKLEQRIDCMENSFPRVKAFVLYGGCELSARLDLARAVARRAERAFWRIYSGKYCDKTLVAFMNRISDYLYMCARYTDYLNEQR